MTELCRIEPWLQRLLAPNPSAMTERGTNTWILGQDRLVVIDPGPAIAEHLEAIEAALAGRPLEAILVTHAHLDHSALAPALAQRTGAPILGFGGAGDGRSPLMRALAASGQGGGEGLDQGFVPDQRLHDGESLELGGMAIRVIHTPGHMAGHLCFAVGDALFSGDHVMGWSSSLVSPPDGDMGAYMTSLRKLAGQGWRTFHPGHGVSIGDPEKRLSDLLSHRAAREAAILAVLAQGPQTPDELVTRIYLETPPNLHAAARRNVFSHLIDLYERKQVRAETGLSDRARFILA